MLTRISLPVALVLLVCFAAARGDENAAPRPVTIQELSLLLRSGYTGDEVLKETAGRPLLAPLDAAAEHALLDAGADARTISALREGRRVASTAEAAEAQQRQSAADQHRLESWEADQGRRMEENRKATETKLAARRDEQFRQIATSLREKLVIRKNGSLEPYDEKALAAKKMFLFYVATAGDRASHQLTPQLVAFYQKFAPVHPEFELVLLSPDQSSLDMEQSMQKESMPWPALAWDQLAKQPGLAALGKDGIPRLVLVDGSGRKLSDNFENGKFAGTQRVIDALKAQFGVTSGPTAAR